jgi:hypothetical protein
MDKPNLTERTLMWFFVIVAIYLGSAVIWFPMIPTVR